MCLHRMLVPHLQEASRGRSFLTPSLELDEPQLPDRRPVRPQRWPILVKFGQSLTHDGRGLPVLADFGQDWANICHFGPNLLRLQPKLARHGQHMANTWPKLARIGRIWAGSPLPKHLWDNFRASFGQRRSAPSSHGVNFRDAR